MGQDRGAEPPSLPNFPTQVSLQEISSSSPDPSGQWAAGPSGPAAGRRPSARGGGLHRPAAPGPRAARLRVQGSRGKPVRPPPPRDAVTISSASGSPGPGAGPDRCGWTRRQAERPWAEERPCGHLRGPRCARPQEVTPPGQAGDKHRLGREPGRTPIARGSRAARVTCGEWLRPPRPAGARSTDAPDAAQAGSPRSPRPGTASAEHKQRRDGAGPRGRGAAGAGPASARGRRGAGPSLSAADGAAGRADRKSVV